LDPAALAVALAENWDEGVRRLGRGSVMSWVKREVEDDDIINALQDVADDSRLDAEQKLAAALLVLSSDLPLLWRREVVSAEWLPANVETAVHLLTGTLPKWLKRCRGESWMEDLTARRDRIWQQLKAGSAVETPSLKSTKEIFAATRASAVTIDTALAERLILLPPDSVNSEALELRKTLHSSRVPLLTNLLTKEDLQDFEAILLLACDRGQLVTHKQFEDARQRAHGLLRVAAAAVDGMREHSLPGATRTPQIPGYADLTEVIGKRIHEAQAWLRNACYQECLELSESAKNLLSITGAVSQLDAAYADLRRATQTTAEAEAQHQLVLGECEELSEIADPLKQLALKEVPGRTTPGCLLTTLLTVLGGGVAGAFIANSGFFGPGSHVSPWAGVAFGAFSGLIWPLSLPVGTLALLFLLLRVLFGYPVDKKSVDAQTLSFASIAAGELAALAAWFLSVEARRYALISDNARRKEENARREEENTGRKEEGARRRAKIQSSKQQVAQRRRAAEAVKNRIETERSRILQDLAEALSPIGATKKEERPTK
jgi:hypothetical protein